jgi:hypothetical protein
MQQEEPPKVITSAIYFACNAMGKKIPIAEFWTKQKNTTAQFALQKVPNPNALGDITVYHQHAMQGLCQSHDLISFYQGL